MLDAPGPAAGGSDGPQGPGRFGMDPFTLLPFAIVVFILWMVLEIFALFLSLIWFIITLPLFLIAALFGFAFFSSGDYCD